MYKKRTVVLPSDNTTSIADPIPERRGVRPPQGIERGLGASFPWEMSDAPAPAPAPSHTPDEVAEADRFGADFEKPEPTTKVAVPEDLQPVLGAEMELPTEKVEVDGQVLDRAQGALLYNEVVKALINSRTKTLQLGGKTGKLSPESLREERNRIETEALSITRRMVADSSGVILHPEKVFTDREDTDLIAAGRLPVREGGVAGLAKGLHEGARDVYSDVTEGLGVKEDVGELSRKWSKGGMPIIKDAIDENNDLVIPSRVAGVPMRSVVSYIYPSAGWEFGEGRWVSKAAQGAWALPLARASTQKEILDEKRAEGQEIGVTDWFEAFGEAQSDPRTVRRIRANLSSWEYAQEDDVKALSAIPWLATKALTGESIYDLMKEEALKPYFGVLGPVLTPGLDAGIGAGDVIQALRPRGMAATGAGIQAAAFAAAHGGDAKKAFTETRAAAPGVGGLIFGNKYMSGDEFDTEFLGPMTVAMVSPDGFMAAVGAISKGVKGFRAARGAIYAAQAEKELGALRKLQEHVEKMVASGDEFRIPDLKEYGLNMALRNQLTEAFRGIVGKADNLKTRGISDTIEKNAKAAQVKWAEAAKIVEESGATVNPRLHRSSAGTGKYKPLFHNIPRSHPGAPDARRIVAQAEAESLQHRLFGLRMTEMMLGEHLGQLKKFGVVGGGGRKVGSSFAQEKRILERAVENLRAVATGAKGASGNIDMAIRAVNDSFLAVARHGSNYATDAVKALHLDTKTAAAAVEMDLDALFKASASEGFMAEAAVGAQLKRVGESISRLAAEKGIGKGVLSSAQKARALAIIETMADSVDKAAGALRNGRAAVKDGTPLARDFVRFERMDVGQKVQHLRSLKVWDALERMPEVKKLAAGNDLTPKEASTLLNAAARRGSADPFSAWGMESYLSHTQGANRGGTRAWSEGATGAEKAKAYALGTAYNAATWTEGVVAALKTSGMRRIFQFVASKDVYNAGRMAQGFTDMGMKEVSDIVESMTKDGYRAIKDATSGMGRDQAEATAKVMRKAQDEKIMKTIEQFMDARPEQALGPFGMAGNESPLEEAFRFLRNMDKDSARGSTSFRAMAHSFLGSGNKSGDVGDVLMAALYKMVEDSATKPVRYADVVKKFRQITREVGDYSVKSHQHLSAGIINAAAGQRMVEQLAMLQVGFDPKTLRAALKAGNQSGSDSFSRAAEVRALLQQMGITPENFRSLTRGDKGGGKTWDLVMMTGDSGGLKAVVPRPLIDFLGQDISHLVKARDAGKTSRWLPSMRELSAAYGAAVRLARKFMTSGVKIPRPSYFINNLHGGTSQAVTSAGVIEGIKSTMAVGGAFRKISFLSSGVPSIDARMAKAAAMGRVAGQKHATSIPNPMMGGLNPFIRGILDDALIPPSQTFRTEAGEVVSKRQLIQEMIKEGVFESKSSTFLLKSPIFKPRDRISKVGNILEKWTARLVGDTDRWARLMDTIEREQRIGLFMESRMNGGFSGGEAGRIVREAYFDWKYPPSFMAEAVASRIPVMMFGSMWRNAADHTLAMLMDPRKAARLMTMWKGQEIAAEGLSSGDTDSHRKPWWADTQNFITMDADPETAALGKVFLGAETGNIAMALPEFISLGLTAMTVNTALMTAATVQTGFQEPITRNNFDAYFNYLISTSSKFLDPYLMAAVQSFTGGGDLQYGGGYDGPVRMTMNEATIAASLSQVERAQGWDSNPLGFLHAEIKEDKATGGTKMVADQAALRKLRLVPTFTRLTNVIGPMLRGTWGDDSAEIFQEIMLRELGRAPQHVPTEAEALRQRDYRLKGAAGRLK